MSTRKDGKHIAKRLDAESAQKVEPAHGNVISILCDWLDDGNPTRAINGLAAAIKYDNVQILEGTLQRPQAIGLSATTAHSPPDNYTEFDVVIALNQLREVGHKKLEIESYSHLASLIGLPDLDQETLRSAIDGMEWQEVLMLYQHEWPWELSFMEETLVAA